MSLPWNVRSALVRVAPPAVQAFAAESVVRVAEIVGEALESTSAVEKPLPVEKRGYLTGDSEEGRTMGIGIEEAQESPAGKARVHDHNDADSIAFRVYSSVLDNIADTLRERADRPERPFDSPEQAAGVHEDTALALWRDGGGSEADFYATWPAMAARIAQVAHGMIAEDDDRRRVAAPGGKAPKAPRKPKVKPAESDHDRRMRTHWASFDVGYIPGVKRAIERGSGFTVERVYVGSGARSVLEISAPADYKNLDLDVNSGSSPLRYHKHKPANLGRGSTVERWESIYGEGALGRPKTTAAQALEAERRMRLAAAVEHYIGGEGDPDDDPKLAAAIEEIRDLGYGRAFDRALADQDMQSFITDLGIAQEYARDFWGTGPLSYNGGEG